MSATTIRTSNVFTAIFSPVLVILSMILSFLVAGNPANFQPYVKENVTTETAKITVIAENKTLNNVGDPRVRSIEKLQEGEWVTAGAYDCFTDDYSVYHVFSTFKETIHFEGMNMGKTLPEGEYRVVITFCLEGKRSDSTMQTAYAYFTVTSP